MKISVLMIIAVAVMTGNAYALNLGPGKLANDGISSIQAFVPDPAKTLVPINLNGSKVFKKGPGADYDITGWLAINISPSGTDLTRYFNSDTTKTHTIFWGQDNIIIIHPDVTQITITGTDARVEIEGM